MRDVIVDLDDDPAFDRPTKPIGPFLSEEAARFVEIDAIPAGSMGPKVRAADSFVERGPGRAVITTPELGLSTLADANPSNASVGTRITHDSRQEALG